MKKPLPGEAFGPQDPPLDDPDFAKAYPNLLEMLTATEYEGGHPRTTSTLLIFCERGILRCCLNDRDNNRSAFLSETTVEGALVKIEEGLATGRIDWRSRSQSGFKGASTPF